MPLSMDATVHAGNASIKQEQGSIYASEMPLTASDANLLMFSTGPARYNITQQYVLAFFGNKSGFKS